MKNCPLKIFYINICIYVNCSYLFSHTLKTASETFIKPHLYSHLQFFSCANTIKIDVYSIQTKTAHYRHFTQLQFHAFIN